MIGFLFGVFIGVFLGMLIIGILVASRDRGFEE